MEDARNLSLLVYRRLKSGRNVLVVSKTQPILRAIILILIKAQYTLGEIGAETMVVFFTQVQIVAQYRPANHGSQQLIVVHAYMCR